MKFFHLLVYLILLFPILSYSDVNIYGNTDSYDYSLTHMIESVNKSGYALGLPAYLNQEGMGGDLVYSMILKYADQYEDIIFPLTDAQYRLTLLGPGQRRNIFIGDAWLAYENKVAFMGANDYERLIESLNNHYQYHEKRLEKDKPKEFNFKAELT